MGKKLVTDEQVVAAYKDTGSVWQAAKRLGISGQTIWERLKSLNYRMTGTMWSEEEHAELETLAGRVSISEIARRLGRPYGTVAMKLSERGLSGRVRSAAKKTSLDAAGLTEEAVKELTDELIVFAGTITQFCRQRSTDIDQFVKAIQKYDQEFWATYSRLHAAGPQKACEYCQAMFYPLSMKQRTCTRKCQADARVNRQYFNGNRQNTIGLAEGVCQLCLQEKQILCSHHCWGKENDNEGRWLEALCVGCHKLVGTLASVKNSGAADFYERLIGFAKLRREGARKPVGFNVYVDIDELTEGDIEDAA